MACLDMYNKSNDHKKSLVASSSSSAAAVAVAPPPMSPRISFSNDFVESSSGSGTSSHSSNPHMMMRAAAYRDAPVSSDFEFSVSNYSAMSTMSADELFFKGKLLPFKQVQKTTTTTTLRDELQVQDDEDDDGCVGGGGGSVVDGFSSVKPPKSSTRWKGLLGLKKSHHIASKKLDKTHQGSLHKRPNLPFDDDSQEQNPREFEFRI